jgi:hypothetical protein
VIRACSTPGCERAPEPNFAVCNTDLGRLTAAAFGPKPPAHSQVERLSERPEYGMVITGRPGRAA